MKASQATIRPLRTIFTLLLAGVVGSIAIARAAAQTPSPELVEQGRQIYEVGRDGSGNPLRATRGGGIDAIGRAAACVRCHQRSGFGLFEGTSLIPPITGPALFRNAQPTRHSTRRAKGIAHQEFPFLTRPPYTERTLARALREGISPSGHRFGYLMPRYALGEEDMAALIAYLRRLSSEPSPGIDHSTAHFALVVAPNQEDARRRAVKDVLQACFEERHPRGDAGQSWVLHVWDLVGAPETWQPQLQAKYAEQPVFALVSGLASGEWDPVHRFSQAERLPVLFPNVVSAPNQEEGGYTFYFSKGIVLEAEVIARYLQDQGTGAGLTRLVQVRREEGTEATASAALRSALKGLMTVEDRTINQATPKAIAQSLAGLSKSDALVVWLDRNDLASLGGVSPPDAGAILFSGWLSGLENAPLPPDWKRVSLMVYPVDAPQRRNARMQFNLRPWLIKHGIGNEDEILLGNTLAACNLLTEGMLHLRGDYFRDRLVELTENYPSGMGNAPAPEAFPRFVIGPGQRFSSRGAYIVRFKAPDSAEVQLVHDWIVPD